MNVGVAGIKQAKKIEISSNRLNLDGFHETNTQFYIENKAERGDIAVYVYSFLYCIGKSISFVTICFSFSTAVC